MKYIDIHTHTFCSDPEVTCMVNVFPGQKEKLGSPAFFSVGLHPWHIPAGNPEELLNEVNDLAADPRVIAIGETGLDKTIDIPMEKQADVFKKQLEIAGSRGKAVILHCVRAYSEMLYYRKRSDLSIPWIFHWFNADEQMADQLIRKNCFLSFGHKLFIAQSKSCRVFKSLSPEHVFFETDDAGLTIQEIYRKACEIRKMSAELMESVILNNFARCFKTNLDGTLVKQD